MKLVESIEGCADCAAEEAWQLSIGHECGEPSDRWSTFCEVIRDARLADDEFHRIGHQPERCDGCGAVLDDRRSESLFQTRLCASDLCDEWFCPFCGLTASSSGPVDCPSCGSLGDDSNG